MFQTGTIERRRGNLEKRRSDRGTAQAQAQENPGKRLDSMKESLLFPEPKEFYGSLAKTSGQPQPSNLLAHSASPRVCYHFLL